MRKRPVVFITFIFLFVVFFSGCLTYNEKDTLLKNIKGKYIYGNTSFGEYCKLWLNGRALKENEFYLDTGFMGDCGGNRTVYTGEYVVKNNKIQFEIVLMTDEEWDDTIEFEKSKETKMNKTVYANVIQDNENIYIEIEISGKKYLLERME